MSGAVEQDGVTKNEVARWYLEAVKSIGEREGIDLIEDIEEAQRRLEHCERLCRESIMSGVSEYRNIAPRLVARIRELEARWARHLVEDSHICERLMDADPCGECAGCIEAGREPDPLDRTPSEGGGEE